MGNGGKLRVERVNCDFAVIGGGMAGLLAALAAARRGVDTVLVTDRPVLGGNASKEMRVWVSGAEGGANNRYHRETGILEEIRLENMVRCPEGSAEIWDSILLEKAVSQRNLRLFMNTIVDAAGKSGRRVAWAEGTQLASERRFRFVARFYADCTGDGTLGALAGAKSMWGREARSRFGESFAPARAERRTMGASILFAVKDAGKPVDFIRPAWAHRLTARDFRWRSLPSHRGGCDLWWEEYGGQLDTIRDNEEIRMELLRIVMGTWDFIKNEPRNRAKSRNLDLEWVGTMPAKRDNRRFMGDHVLTQRDVIDKPDFPDAVAYGGWSLDDHPSGGFYDRRPPSTHYYLPGIYNIPLRSLYSANVPNLFFAGRDASASHVAMSTTRVMATGAQMGEAVGATAALALRRRAAPRAIANGPLVRELQQDLLRADHYIVGMRNEDPGDMARDAIVTASSSAAAELTGGNGTEPLGRDRVLMFPISSIRVSAVTLRVRARKSTSLSYALHGTDRKGDFLPGPLLARGRVRVPRGGSRPLELPLNALTQPGFHWLVVARNSALDLAMTAERRPGIGFFQRDAQEGGNWWNDFSPWGWQLWRNPIFGVLPRQEAYRPESVINGYSRPFLRPNLWVSDRGFPQWLRLSWDRPRPVRLVQLRFDTDLDWGIRNLWGGMPFRTFATCIRDYRLVAETASGRRVIAEVRGNYQRLREHAVRVTAGALRITVLDTNGAKRAHIYEVRVY